MFKKFIEKAFILFFGALTILSGGAAATAQICRPASEGLVSWYRAEGSAADAQGVNDGSLQNGTGFAAGRVGRAFKFDGSDDFVEIPDAASLKPQSLTVEAWIRFDDLTGATSGNAPAGFQYILNKKNQRPLMFEAYSLIKLPNHQIGFSVSTSAGPHTTVVDATQTIVVGRFYHVVGTYDGATARLYVNGRKVGEAAHGFPLEYDTRPLFIGTSGEALWDGKMNGLIDEVRIYDRALPDAQVGANYLTGLSLIANCDAEDDRDAPGNETTDTDVSGWENETGEFTVIRYGTNSFPSASSPGSVMRGAFFFAGGRAPSSGASQIVDLSAHAARIDAGIQNYNLSGYLGGFADQADNARLTATFRDASQNALGTATLGPVTAAERGGVTGLLWRSATDDVPSGARSVEITLTMTRLEGAYNDGYADNLSFDLIRAANVPADLVSWSGGDGDARDFQNANNGTPDFNPGFVVGKAGQAFRFQNGSHVRIDSDGIFRGRTEGTIEAWIRPRALPNGEFRQGAIWVESEASRNFTRLGLYYSDAGQVGVYANNSTVNAVAPTPLPLGEWAHVAGTYRAGEGSKIYVNGVLAASSPNSGGALSNDLGAFLGIGVLRSAAGDDFDFNGDIDEPSVYARALSLDEIQTVFNAGTAGKARRVPTGAGANVAVTARDATLTFAEVATAGETSQTPLETAALPELPSGYAHTGLAYDISTTAVFTGNINICFNLPALADANFPRLRLLHLENGSWVDRTTALDSPRLCGLVSQLSPFVVAENLAPTAASVIVGGRVVTATGQGVYRARVTMVEPSGAARTAVTNAFGFYRFAEVPAGATYVLHASAKQYVFAPESMVINVADDLLNADFTAQESYKEARRKDAVDRK